MPTARCAPPTWRAWRRWRRRGAPPRSRSGAQGLAVLAVLAAGAAKNEGKEEGGCWLSHTPGRLPTRPVMLFPRTQPGGHVRGVARHAAQHPDKKVDHDLLAQPQLQCAAFLGEGGAAADAARLPSSVCLPALSFIQPPPACPEPCADFVRLVMTVAIAVILGLVYLGQVGGRAAGVLLQAAAAGIVTPAAAQPNPVLRLPTRRASWAPRRCRCPRCKTSWA